MGFTPKPPGAATLPVLAGCEGTPRRSVTQASCWRESGGHWGLPTAERAIKICIAAKRGGKNSVLHKRV